MYVLDNADMSRMYVNHSSFRLFITESVKQNCLACICCVSLTMDKIRCTELLVTDAAGRRQMYVMCVMCEVCL